MNDIPAVQPLADYESVLQSIPHPLFVLDKRLRFVYLNPAAEKLCGRSARECRGMTCSTMASPLCGTRECCFERFRRGEPPALQHAPDGRVYRVSLGALHGEDGQEIGFVSVSTDVTGLVAAQTQLRISQERCRVALEMTNDTLWEYDVASDTAYRLDLSEEGTGPAYPDAARTLVESGIVRPESARELVELTRRIRAGEARGECVVRMMRSGTLRWVRITCSTVFDEDGAPLRAVGVTRDVTQERELEERFAVERQYRASLTASAMSAYEVNLTRDRIIRADSDWSRALDLGEERSYSQFVQSVRAGAVHPRHRESFVCRMSREALLGAYEAGEREVRCEYLRLNPERKTIWVCSTVFLSRLPEGDVCAFIYLKDIDRQKRRELELEQKAQHDPLTGLLNRSAMEARIAQALAETADSPAVSALYVLDVDDFKAVNDTFGHPYGDNVLCRLAQRLRSMFRREDLLCRFGGDEFVVFLTRIPDEATAVEKAQRLCGELRLPLAPGSGRPAASVCVGVSVAPRHGATFAALYAKADAALYRAKREGKNRCVLYEDGCERRD